MPATWHTHDLPAKPPDVRKRCMKPLSRKSRIGGNVIVLPGGREVHQAGRIETPQLSVVAEDDQVLPRDSRRR